MALRPATATLIALAILAVSSEGLQSQHGHAPVIGETQVVSPTVVATWAHSGTRLDGLVLWRGKPGWFAGRDGRRESGGGRGGAVFAEIVYGGRRLNMEIKDGHVTVGLDGSSVGNPRAGNVILVDRVDEDRERWTIDAMSITDTLEPQNVRLQDILRTSPRMVAFLQCDLRSADQREQAVFDRLCAPFTGR